MKKINLGFYTAIILIAVSILIVSCKEKKEPEKQEVKKEKPVVKKETPKKDSVMKVEPKPVVPKKKFSIYVVQQDDWLWKISRNEYGTALSWDKIYEANKEKINNPNMIFPGQELIIPE